MTDDVGDSGLDDALLEALDVPRVVRRRTPHPWALGEDLDRLAAQCLGSVDCRVEPAGARHMAPEAHATTILGPCQYASAWLRHPPATSTSAAYARFSSTGCSPGATAARSCCGSRTRMSVARSPSRLSRSSARCAGSASTGTA